MACGDGGIGRRSRLKTDWAYPPVRVQVPLPTPPSSTFFFKRSLLKRLRNLNHILTCRQVSNEELRDERVLSKLG